MMFYPVNLNISDRLCLVIGGGMVAYRKTQSLLQCGARVRVVSPVVVDGLRELALRGEIELFEREYASGDLMGAFLAFAATGNPMVQSWIQEEATERKVLLNSATSPTVSTFHVPAHFRRGKILVTVSTGGSSPALARRLRERFENEIGPGYAAVSDLLSILRDAVLAGDADAPGHAVLFNRLLDSGLIELVKDKQWFELQMLLLQELPEHCDGVELMRVFLDHHDRG